MKRICPFLVLEILKIVTTSSYTTINEFQFLQRVLNIAKHINTFENICLQRLMITISEYRQCNRQHSNKVIRVNGDLLNITRTHDALTDVFVSVVYEHDMFIKRGQQNKRKLRATSKEVIKLQRSTHFKSQYSKYDKGGGGISINIKQTIDSNIKSIDL